MIDDCKVIAVTLARGGSKGIPQKNLVELWGNPLLYYTIAEAKKSKYIDEYYISTDDKDISQYARQEGCTVIDRPKNLATDSATSAQALIHAVKSKPCQYVVELMCTNPLKTCVDIDCCIKKLHSCGHDSVVSVVRIYDHHPSRIKYIENDTLKSFFPEQPEGRRQDLSPPAYVRNGSIYAMRYSALIETGRRYNDSTSPYIMPPERSINIDEPIDLALAKTLRCEIQK